MNGPLSSNITLGGATAIACTKNTAVYTDVIDLSNLSVFALAIILAGTGAVSVKVEMEQSWVLPATANTADGSWLVPTGVSDVISNLAVKTQQLIALSPIAMRYMRLKLTDLTNVSTTTVATAVFSFSNRFGSMT